MPTIIDLRPEIEKVSGRIAIVALLILCLCIKVYTTQFWHDMNVDHRVKCKVIDRIVEDETITQDGNSTTKKVNKLVLQAEGFNNTFKHVKESTKCGLKEAKDFVDTYCDYVLND